MRRSAIFRIVWIVYLPILALAHTTWGEEHMDASSEARKVAGAFRDAWNRHDVDALPMLFHPNASFVNIRGGYWKGRDAIREGHARIHTSFYKSSQITMDVQDVAVLCPSVAVAHVRSDLTGDERLSGGTRHTLMTLVVTEQDGRWAIAAAQNTEIAPPPPEQAK
jgi:uncharacterized protein (TIGR02246 family)